VTAVVTGELIQLLWRQRSSKALQWKRLEFEQVEFPGPFATFVVSAAFFLTWVLVVLTHKDFRVKAGEILVYDLDAMVGLEPGQMQRAILSLVIVLRAMKIVLLLRSNVTVGKLVLSVIYSVEDFQGMFAVLVVFYAGFAAAFISIEGLQTGGVLASLLPIYRGILFGDGDGLDQMAGKDDDDYTQGIVGQVMMVSATFFMTLVLVNISIGVFSDSYSTAVNKSDLVFWHERARVTTHVMLNPAWPWQLMESTSEEDKKEVQNNTPPEQIAVNFYVNILARALSFTSPVFERLFVDTASKDADSQREKWKIRGPMLMAGVVTEVVLVLLTCLFFHLGIPIPCAFFGAATLVVAQSLLSCNKYATPWLDQKKYFLWICARADFDPGNFISDDVEKEDIDAVKEQLEKVGADLGEQIKELTALVKVQAQNQAELTAFVKEQSQGKK